MGKRTVLAEKLDHIRLAFRNSCRVLTASPPRHLVEKNGPGPESRRYDERPRVGFSHRL
jgi:hypothetical protein